jgi:hypothetical protein
MRRATTTRTSATSAAIRATWRAASRAATPGTKTACRSTPCRWTATTGSAQSARAAPSPRVSSAARGSRRGGAACSRAASAQKRRGRACRWRQRKRRGGEARPATADRLYAHVRHMRACVSRAGAAGALRAPAGGASARGRCPGGQAASQRAAAPVSARARPAARACCASPSALRRRGCAAAAARAQEQQRPTPGASSRETHPHSAPYNCAVAVSKLDKRGTCTSPSRLPAWRQHRAAERAQ